MAFKVLITHPPYTVFISLFQGVILVQNIIQILTRKLLTEHRNERALEKLHIEEKGIFGSFEKTGL